MNQQNVQTATTATNTTEDITYIEVPISLPNRIQDIRKQLEPLVRSGIERIKVFLKDSGQVQKLEGDLSACFDEIVEFFRQDPNLNPLSDLMDHELRNIGFYVNRFLSTITIVPFEELEEAQKESYPGQVLSGLNVVDSFLTQVAYHIDQRVAQKESLHHLISVAESLNLESFDYKNENASPDSKPRISFIGEVDSKITFREYIIIRTLVDNALKEYKKQNIDNGEVIIQYYHDGDDIIIGIMDKATDTWPKVVHKFVNEGIELAREKDAKITSQNGTKLSAYILKKESPNTEIKLVDVTNENRYKVFEIRRKSLMISQETI